MAKEPYLELILYRAHCNAEGVSEGKLDGKKEDNYSKEKFSKAMEVVQRHLSYKGRDDTIREGIIESEEEVENLVEYVEKNIPGSDLQLRLIHSLHGRILFEKLLVFKGYDYPQTKEVSDKLKNSGIGHLEILSDFFWINNLRSYG